jgi:HD superfamily phosphohydrolase
MALLYLKRLSYDERFSATVSRHDAEVFLVAALVHDLGHWPFCHPIEDIELPGVPDHELFANSFLLEGEIADTLRDDWDIQPREVVALLSEKPRDRAMKILQSMLSGPIDIDKMDYLSRDSLHAGVPYGQNFDQQRLIGSLCLNQAGDGLAITAKGKTAAEMMVFARYVMFSEVYWHHTVRAGTAQLQRAFFLLLGELDLDGLFRMGEQEMIDAMLEAASTGPAGELLEGLFGPTRQLYKRAIECSVFQHCELYVKLARQPYPWLAACSEQCADIVSHRLARRVAPHEILFDAPPVQLEVEFNVDVYFPNEDCYRTLGEISPVVSTLAREQFDDYVKRVRVFVHPKLMDELRSLGDLAPLVDETIRRMD